MNERVQPLEIPGVLLIEAAGSADERGGFFECLTAGDLQAAGCGLEVAQVNCSVSVRGALRGIAVTTVPPGQAKVVACVAGEVLDVAVDLRVGSPAFGAWHAERLGDGRRAALVLPPGTGHAFLSLADGSAVVYLLSHPHDPERERRVHPLDPGIGIGWPPGIAPVMSPRDASAPGLQESLEAGLLPGYSACLAAGQHKAR
ncbi:MAG TPA: dTDP-4-dehydrorhamnose 3,5-epimerase family protein [Streptosporangiaceae bacterium]|nr:dTDP-4-dehydrorhamnose 3,5-epimerase family protein [Streptosporangiaceae bacterium]